MSFMLWQREGDTRIGANRLVLRAAEVPLLQHALALREMLEERRDAQVQLIADAVAEGFARGEAEGLAAGRRAAADEAAGQLLALSTHAAAERERLRHDVGALALQVVRKLLGGFADDSVLAALAATASADLLPGALPTLVVHPRHGEALRTRLAAAEAAGAPPVELRTDAACGPDDCRLETEHGSVDVALEAQLARLAAAWGVTLPPVGAVATDATAHDGGDAASAGGESTGGANADDASAGANGNSYHVNRAASSGAAAASRQTP